jgi:hypothetical protein
MHTSISTRIVGPPWPSRTVQSRIYSLLEVSKSHRIWRSLSGFILHFARCRLHFARQCSEILAKFDMGKKREGAHRPEETGCFFPKVYMNFEMTRSRGSNKAKRCDGLTRT